MSAFSTHLRRIRFLLRGTRLLGAWLGLLALAATLWLLFGLTDAVAAFETSARIAITAVLVASCAIALLIALIRSLRVSARTAAACADAALADPRCPVAASLSLDPAAAPTPLAQLLTTRTLDSAAAALAALPAKKLIPWRFPGLALLALTVPLLAIGSLRLAQPAAFATITARLRHPAADIPPYSPLVFTLDPAKPATVYGGDLLISAEITGAALTRPVECLIRQARTGDILRLPAFREAPTRFSRKLDGLTEPLEIAFASGKARSTWHTVEILLEPNILNGLVRLTPPAYTGLPATEFPLDTNEIAAIEGATVTLELTSNRPLGSATLVFTPATVPGAEPVPQAHPATLPASHTAAFTWTATQSGRLSATLRDLRGTPSPRPLDLAFRTLPDLPPSVVLTSPPPMLLATPKSFIPVVGRAQDDFALAKIHWVRTLSGFRDRARIVAPALRDKSYDFADQLDLAELGLDAGQTIELMLEASDHNPSLLGQGSSEISRIRIISDDQYAQYLRAKTTIAQFAKRFQAARDAIDHARKALENLQQATDKGEPDAIKKAADEAKNAHAQAADLLDKIARDFPAFELEKRLQDLAEKQADDLRENIPPLENFDPKAPKADQQAAIDEMLKRLGRQQPQAEQLDEDVNKVNQTATLLEMAAKFRQIYESQANLAKRFGTIVEELRQGDDQNRRLLPSLAETQEKNRLALDDFKTELRRRAEALPKDDPDLTPMLDSALKFLDDLTEAAPESLMDAAAKHGKAGDAADAYANAERARALLERLLSEPEPFPQAAKGQAPQFNIPRPDINQNLQQLLDALLGQNPGQGKGEQPGGQGQGPAGPGLAGAPGGGFPMDLPVVGPERLQFSDAAPAGSGRNGEGQTRPVQPLPATAEVGTLKPTTTRQGQATTATPEAIPEPYRQAVRKFLTP
ncbi:MAG: hypothetical protein NTW21_34380 [Verrucomicrobia bacterium]|nr:hypothetical protein [Verrucomicrobiota bacterium]